MLPHKTVTSIELVLPIKARNCSLSQLEKTLEFRFSNWFCFFLLYLFVFSQYCQWSLSRFSRGSVELVFLSSGVQRYALFLSLQTFFGFFLKIFSFSAIFHTFLYLLGFLFHFLTRFFTPFPAKKIPAPSTCRPRKDGTGPAHSPYGIYCRLFWTEKTLYL